MREPRAEHYRTLSAVMLFLTRRRNGKTELLLQRRQNTGYGDGMWDCGVSGHVDEGESMKMAVAREAAEELGITLDPGDIAFCTLTHRTGSGYNATYYNAYFRAERYAGDIRVNEPEKCSELGWFPVDSLPEDWMEDRRSAWTRYQNGIPYAEEGWTL